MRAKNLRQLLILCFSIAWIASFGQTDVRVCMTPDQYRFFDESVIEKQRLAGENKALNSAVKSLKEAHEADSTANAKLETVLALNGDKEAVYKHDIHLLQDDVDGKAGQITRNRKIAIIGWGSFTIETGLLILGIWAYTR